MIVYELNQKIGNPISAAWWKKQFSLIEKKIKISSAEVSVALVGDAEMRRLNRQYRGKDKTTDVLSFPNYDDTSKINYRKAGFLGEIIISLPQTRRQAKSAGHELNTELQLLLVHGFLHLLGYDHVNDAEAEIMETLEQKIINTQRKK